MASSLNPVALGARLLVRVLGTTLLTAAICWSLVEAAPGSLTRRAARAGGLLPADSARIPATLEADILASVERRHGLDRPAHERVAARVLALCELDFGVSWRDRTPVRTTLARAMGPTALLWLLALGLAALLGLSGAVLAVRGHGGKLDSTLSALAGVAFAIPPVWLALLALGAFADGKPWRWLPAEGLDSPAALILPVLCMALVPTFVLARHARAAFLIAIRSPWATAARARGASLDRVLWVHASRVCLGQLVTLLPVLTAYLTGVSLVIEEVFGIPGLGVLMLDASQRGDAPVVVGVAVLAAVLIAAASALSELVQRFADPRVANG